MAINVCTKAAALARMGRRLVLASAAAAAVGGCAVNPYIQAPGIAQSIPGRAQPPGAGSPPSPAAATPQFAGDIEAAIRDLDAQRTAYHEALRDRALFRNVVNPGTIVLSALGVYRGLTASTEAGRRVVAMYGAGAGLSYGLGQYAISSPTEEAYIEGARDLTCLAANARPWLMTVADHASFTHALGALEEKLNAFDKTYQEEVAAQTGRSGRSEFLDETVFYRKSFDRQRNLLMRGHTLRAKVETAGYELRQQAMLVGAEVNGKVQRALPSLNSPSVVVDLIAASARKANSIRPEPPVDQQGEESHKNTPSGGGAGGWSSAAASVITTTATQVTVSKSGTTTVTTVSTAGAATPTTAKDLDELKRSLRELRSAHQADARAKSAAIQRLGEISTRIQDSLGAMQSLPLVVTATARLTTTTVAGSGAASTTTVSVFAHATATREIAVVQVPPPASAPWKRMANAMTDMYAAGRPVNLTLARHHALAKQIQQTSDCQARAMQVLRFTAESDQGPIPLQPGQVVEVTVAGGAEPVTVSLGAVVSAGGSNPTLDLLHNPSSPGHPRARLTIPKDMAAGGKVSLFAVDASGRQTAELDFSVGDAPKR